MLRNNPKHVIDYIEVIDQSPRPLILSDEERQKSTFKSPFLQEFSLPSNIFYYIAKNPAFPNGHLKFISTCKFLARMSKILPVKRMAHYSNEDSYKWEANNQESYNFKTQFFKVWIYDEISIWNGSGLASTLVKKIYKSSIRLICLVHQDLTFEELQILVSGSALETVYFHYNVIKNDDGSVTDFEKVFELLCCKELKVDFVDEQHGIGKNTTEKIIQILSSDQVPNEQHICFYDVPQNFDLQLFFEFLKTNMTDRQHTIDLEFAKEISDACKNQLQQFVNEIVQIRGIYAHTVPIIEFHDQNREAYVKLDKMRYEKVEGILRKTNI